MFMWSFGPLQIKGTARSGRGLRPGGAADLGLPGAIRRPAPEIAQSFPKSLIQEYDLNHIGIVITV